MRTDSTAADRVIGRSPARPGSVPLPMPADTRERLAEFYRASDEADALNHESGQQKVRGSVWAAGLKRLERGDDVYESFGVLARAGIELPPPVAQMLNKLPDDWSRICHIDGTGLVTTASLKARKRFGR